MNIQPAGAGGTVTCPWCGHQASFPGDVQKQAIDCGECRRGVDFGVPRPRWFTEPYAADKRFVTLSIETLGEDGPVVRSFVLLREVARPLAMRLLQEVR